MNKKVIVIIFFIYAAALAFPDIPFDIYKKPYTVSFGDWVYVCLHILCANCVGQSYEYGVSVGMETVNQKARYRIVVWFDAHYEKGSRFYFELYPNLKRSIQQICSEWTDKGYPIGLDDIIFEERTQY